MKNEGKITFQDVQDCLILVSSSFSTQTSYENQTKKAITNHFIQEAMTDFLRHHLEVYFLENKAEADRFCDQVLVNKRSREKAETTRLNLKKTLQSGNDLTSRVQSFVDCRTRDVAQRELFIVEGKSAMGACVQARNPDFQAIIPVRGKILNCLKAEYDKIFKTRSLPICSRSWAAEWRSRARPTRTWQPLISACCAGARSLSAPMPMWTASRSAL